MSCNHVSGKAGKVMVDSSLIAQTSMWDFNEEIDDTEFGHSDSDGYKCESTGHKKASGTIEGFFHPDRPAYEVLAAGDEVNLALWITADAGNYFYIPAIIKSFKIASNQENGEPDKWTATYKSDGKYYHPGDAGIPTVNYPS